MIYLFKDKKIIFLNHITARKDTLFAVQDLCGMPKKRYANVSDLHTIHICIYIYIFRYICYFHIPVHVYKKLHRINICIIYDPLCVSFKQNKCY